MTGDIPGDLSPHRGFIGRRVRIHYVARFAQKLVTFSLLFAIPVLIAAAPSTDRVDIIIPRIVLAQVPFEVSVNVSGALESALAGSTFTLLVNEAKYSGQFDSEGKAGVHDVRVSQGPVLVRLAVDDAVIAEATSRAIPGWLSVLPALLAIGVALAFRQVVLALFLAVWLGAWITRGLAINGLWLGLLDTLQIHVIKVITDPDYAAIILFSFMIGGMVGIISRNGGMMGVVHRVIPWANTPRRVQLTATSLGLGLFFDDYANSLVVGNAMRPITDRLRVSREKLAYLVDSTAAPVACLALISTWIGFQVGLIAEAVDLIPGWNQPAYALFLHSIPYSFYPILAVFFAFMIAATGKDFGPMHTAEHRARTSGLLFRQGATLPDNTEDARALAPPADGPRRARNALIPLLVLIVGTIYGLYSSGEGATLREIVGSADPYRSMMMGSLLSVVVAMLLSVGQGILTLSQTIEAWHHGLKTMVLAIVILLLAWSLASVNQQLGTAPFLVSILGERLHPSWIPALVFLLASVIAFSTGTSWGTMGVLMPLVLPLAWAAATNQGVVPVPDSNHVVHASIAAVLAGAVWGDHCSPVADTTILSSLASGCDHVDHVRTQLPYAIVVGAVALLMGLIPAGYGFPWWLSLILAAGALCGILSLWGRRAGETAPARGTPAD